MALQVTENVNNGMTYRNIKLADLGTGDSVKLKLNFDEPRTGTGKFGEWRMYNVDVIEPQLGQVSFFASDGLHNQLTGYKKDDTVTITKEKGESTYRDEKGEEKTRTFTRYVVSSEALVMTEEDRKSIMTAIKSLPEKPSEEKVRTILAEFGFKNEGDVQSVLTLMRS